MPTIPAHLLVPRNDHGAVLVDEGGELPRLDLVLDDDDTIVIRVLRLLRSAWELDGVVLETHLPPGPDGSDGHIALAVLDPPDDAWAPPRGIRWAPPPAILPERVGRRAATWLEEWRSKAAVPALRARWARPGWHARARDWVRDALEVAGQPAAGAFEIRRMWGISATARVETAGGVVWFKAVFPHFDPEVTITRFLGTVVRDAVPHVIAADERQGWLLMGDVGADPIGLAATEAQLAAAIHRLVAIQTALAGHERELRAAGARHRPLMGLADELADAMRHPAEIEGPDVPAGRLTAVVDWVRAEAAWLEGVGLPETLLHGDFHVFNVIERDGAPVIIDWSDAAISHPLLEIGPWFGHPKAPGDPERAWSTWLDALSVMGPVDSLRGERDRVLALASAFQLISYAGIVRNLEPANRYQLSDGVRDFWAMLDARVP